MIEFDALLNAFTTYFVTIDPPGLAAIFLGLTAGMTQAERAVVALRGTLIGLAILLAFLFIGRAILDVLGISMPAFRVAGGLLLFYIAFEMVFEKRAQRQNETAKRIVTRADLQSIAVFPLAIPLIAGPGAISASILLAAEATSVVELSVPLIALVANGVLLYLAFRLAPKVDALMGETGRLILSRLLGILLSALAVQFVADGVLALVKAG
ncbi:MarC family protein [Pseudahrensia aquimaris]|uniref:UPF0056 membrane protein n=1 Tax=Pseudahrensia aquimaris TaxID=744461 RepID=A0ABW3FII7_9HYPH